MTTNALKKETRNCDGSASHLVSRLSSCCHLDVKFQQVVRSI